MRAPFFRSRPFGGLLWLALFGAPTAQALDLMQIWQLAHQHDPQMQVVHATRSAAQAYEAQAKALWRPVLIGSASVGAMSSSTSTRGAQFAVGGQPPTSDVYFGTSTNDGTSTRWGLQAKQALYSTEREAQQQQLEKAASVAELRADLAQQEFMLRTVQRYFDVLLAERQQQVLKNQYAAVNRSLAEVKDRFALGDLPVTDTHEATARAMGLQAQLWVAESELQTVRSVLGASTGLGADALRPLVPKAGVFWSELPTLDQVQAQVRQANLEVLMQKAQWDLAQQELRKHQLGGALTLDLVASVGRERLSGEGNFGISSNSQSQQMLGLSLNVPLYTGGYRSGKLQESLSAADKASAEYDLALQQALQRAQSVWLYLQSGPARLSAMQASWQASAARLEATRLGRQVGDRTTLELLQAENDAAQAELAWLRAQTDLLFTRLQLDALTGVLSVQSLQALNAHLAP